MLTLCAISSKRQGLRTSNLVYRWRTTTCISHMRHDLQGQGHTRPINGVTHRPPNLLNGKVYELQTWYTDGRWRPASTRSAMTSKVKGQGRKVTWSVWAVLAQCCTCVIGGQRGHTVSAEPGGHTSCFHPIVFLSFSHMYSFLFVLFACRCMWFDLKFDVTKRVL